MHWHPYLVHFPIALSVFSFGLYLIFVFSKKHEFHLFSLYALSTSVVTSFFAGISGEKTANLQTISDPLVIQLLERHESLANLFIWGSILTLIVWMFGTKKFTINSFMKWLILSLLMCLTIVILITGRIGGELVYMHGVGILQ